MSLKEKAAARAARSKRQKREMVAINARIPRALKTAGEAALKTLGLKWVDLFVEGIEYVVAKAQRKEMKNDGSSQRARRRAH